MITHILNSPAASLRKAQKALQETSKSLADETGRNAAQGIAQEGKTSTTFREQSQCQKTGHQVRQREVHALPDAPFGFFASLISSPEKLVRSAVFAVIIMMTGGVMIFSLPEEQAKEDLSALMGHIIYNRRLTFEDGENGVIWVRDADSSAIINRYTLGEGGFVRQVMRSFVRDRLRRGIGPQIPFEARITDSGLVILFDPALDRSLALNAYGKDNAAVFMDLVISAAQEKEE